MKVKKIKIVVRDICDSTVKGIQDDKLTSRNHEVKVHKFLSAAVNEMRRGGATSGGEERRYPLPFL